MAVLDDAFISKWSERLLVALDDMLSPSFRRRFLEAMVTSYGVTREGMAKLHRRAQKAEADAKRWEMRACEAEKMYLRVRAEGPTICEVRAENRALRERCKAAESRPDLRLEFARHVLSTSKHRSPSCTPETCAKCAAEAILDADRSAE